MLIACTLYPPGSIQSHPDNPQTPPRHLPDTLQTPQNTEILTDPRQLGENEPANKDLIVNWGFIIACTFYPPPRQYPDSLRQPPGTTQTLSRQSSDIPKHLGEKEPADQDYSYKIFIIN